MFNTFCSNLLFIIFNTVFNENVCIVSVCESNRRLKCVFQITVCFIHSIELQFDFNFIHFLLFLCFCCYESIIC